MKKSPLVLLGTLTLLLLAWGSVTGQPAEGPAAKAASSNHLLDRGGAGDSGPANRGGGPPGPIPLAYAAGPSAVATPFGPGFFPPPGPGPGSATYIGYLFPPGPGYPPGFLTGGATHGFSITGAFAWHRPFNPSPTAGGGSLIQALVMARATPGGVTAGFATAVVGATPPGPSGIIGMPGLIPTGSVVITTTGASPAPEAYCGMLVAGPGAVNAGLPPGWPGNGLGAVSATMAGPALAAGIFPPLTGPTGFVATAPAPPADYIVGCYVEGATTPVELMAFGIE